MRRYSGVIFSTAGVLQAGVDVTIVAANTQTAVPIYNDSMQQVSNPVLTDASGQLTFRVTSGIYDFLDDDGNTLAKEVQIFDFSSPGEWLGIWDFPKTGFTFGGLSSKLKIYGLDDDTLAMDSALRVGGLQGAGIMGLEINGNGLGDPILVMNGNPLDLFPQYKFSSLGILYFGPGGSFDVDTFLGRTASSELTAGGSLVVTGPTLNHKGSLLGFYNTTPIVKPTVIGTVLNATTDATLIALLKSLAQLGLINANFTVSVSGTLAVTVGGTLLTETRRSGTIAVVRSGTATATVF